MVGLSQIADSNPVLTNSGAASWVAAESAFDHVLFSDPDTSDLCHFRSVQQAGRGFEHVALADGLPGVVVFDNNSTPTKDAPPTGDISFTTVAAPAPRAHLSPGTRD